MKKEKDNSLIKKTDFLVKFDPKKKKTLIVRGLKETVYKKVILFVYRDDSVHRLFDEEIKGVFGNKIAINHFYSPKNAFNYLLSNKVDLVISEVLFEDIDGISFLNACKTLYFRLPFIIFSAYDYFEEWFKKFKPDFYIVISSDFSELFDATNKCLEYNFNTDETNLKIKQAEIGNLYNLGLAHYEINNYNEALQAFREAVKINPDHAKAFYGIGNIHMKLARHSEAIEAFKQAISLDSNFKDAHFNLGLSYLALGQKSKALEEYEILQKVNAKLAEELFNKIYK
ncbi:MAG: tetratricopeptide repeat protein [Epsilonproteobacteria bacterium]|nr:tetratricopeptide repeat protein [Campylobacterota bacterium]